MSKVFIIAEAGVNHDGSLDRALELVAVAARAGADAVKFQTFKADVLASAGAGKAAYQARATGGGQSQLEMLRGLELDGAAHRAVADRCRELGLEFMSTPFDFASLELLLELGVRRLKVSSGEVTNAPLLHAMGRSGLPVILSTGMSTLGEVEDALCVLAHAMTGDGKPDMAACREAYASAGGRRVLAERVSVLHCTTEYPAALEDVNLRAMDTLASAFGLATGYSDHTPGITVPVAAAARGARIIEKHFTLDKNLPGPDHAASLEPEELTAMVRSIRAVELALGDPVKAPTAPERANALVARKSLVAARAVRAGEPLSPENVAAKRPGGGPSPMGYWDLMGQGAARDYAPDEFLDQRKNPQGE